MTSFDLKPWQLDKLFKKLHSNLGYLQRLKKRMEVLGFPPNDRLYKILKTVEEDMQHLVMEVHYVENEVRWKR